jgi:tRNA-splicing endonuclease subunit Sen2
MGSSASSLPSSEKQIHRTSRPVRPNFKQIHALPLPVNVYALPPLIPHNPVSVLQIALTYLVQLVVPPTSHPRVLYQGFFSPETNSVHVADENTARIFWERGFFGKGSLSRSEPSWFDREKRRQGLSANETSEEVTKRRRGARKLFKEERARKETEAIEEKLAEEGRKGPNSDNRASSQVDHRAKLSPTPSMNSFATAEAHSSLNLEGNPVLQNHPGGSTKGHRSEQNHVRRTAAKPKENISKTLVSDIQNEEHLQLCPEEAFFLVYGLGVLQIRNLNTSHEIPTESLFSLFRQFSYFPPEEPLDLRPDDPFLVSYVVYHHFRSLGWVVRPGMKFAVDYLLYNRGPVFSHAEFAVIILPAYTHPHWHSNSTLSQATRKKETKSWWWLHCLNRVQSQVRKSLVLVYVEIPPPPGLEALPKLGAATSADGEEAMIMKLEARNITATLKRYKIRELTIRRWTPNRSRD